MSDNKDFPWWLPLYIFFIALPIGILRSMLGLEGKADETHPDDKEPRP